ncbi:hypothetical protein ACU4GD_01560 [Cupriavidus basilensis]
MPRSRHADAVAGARTGGYRAGFQLTLFTIENRRHHGKQLSHWLLQVTVGTCISAAPRTRWRPGHRPSTAAFTPGISWNWLTGRKKSP